MPCLSPYARKDCGSEKCVSHHLLPPRVLVVVVDKEGKVVVPEKNPIRWQA